MRYLKKGVVCPLLPLALLTAVCGFGCRSATAPEQAGELYDFTVTYQRTAILKPEKSDPTELVIVVQGIENAFPLTKVTDVLFTAEVTDLPINVGADALPHAVYVIDPKRFESDTIMGPYDYGRPHSVGDVFVFKSKQTGADTQLTDIVPNTYLWGLPAKCFPRMARFRILKGGTIGPS